MKEKILLVSLNFCYPLVHGGAIAQYYFIDGLKNDIEFVLCTQVNTQYELENIKLLQEKQPKLKIYFTNNIQEKQPNKLPLKPTIWKRIKRKIKKMLFKKKTTINSVLTQAIVDDDFQNPHYCCIDNYQSEKFIQLVNDVIEKESIKQVQFDFYEAINLILAIPKRVRKIFIHHEIRFKRLKLMYDKSLLSPTYKNYIIDKTELYEKLLLKQMDSVVVFNNDDANLLKEICKNVIVSPFGMPHELIYKGDISHKFAKFLFVGSESHRPNLLGLSWFLNEIYIPYINEIKYPVYIVGSWSDGIKNMYKIYSQIVFCGVVDSIQPYFEESIFVNPILTGSGIRTKVLHAYINKVPVMSTRFGAEGCYNEYDNSHLLFFDSAVEFMNAMLNITVPQLQNLALAGFDYYNKEFNKDTLLKKRLNVYTI